jgi:hypothetical protein
MSDLSANVQYGHERFGWSFTPLKGKRPKLAKWQARPREPLAQALAWAGEGNVGLRTGPASGIIVVDVDIGGDIEPLNLPATVAVRTGNNGLHLYYRCREPLGNSSGKLGPNIDTRGHGGQVVYPGSVHPDTGQVYEWDEGYEPWTVDAAELPQHIVELLKADKKPAKREKAKPQASVSERHHRYAMTAVAAELEAVATAPEGTRNDRLNVGAFNLGQLVGAGLLAKSEIVAALLSAAETAGLPRDEAETTIRSGLASGMAKPREIAERELPSAKHFQEQAYTLKPGPHVTDTGEYIERSSDQFAEEAVASLPGDLLYRKDYVVGKLIGDPGRRRWLDVDKFGMLMLVDKHARPGRWIKSKGTKDQEGEPVMKYETCTQGEASCALVKAVESPNVRDLSLLVNYPIYGPLWQRVQPGYHAGLFYDEPPELDGLQPYPDCEWIHNVLHDLVVDFPFRSDADRQNFFGLLLTPIVAAAIQANRPMHLIHASLERTGKSKLAEQVFGGIILGRATPAMQLTDREDEREKRIMSVLLHGDTLVHLDNLPGFIDSPALSSLLTAQVFQGRILGQSQQLSIPNYMTVVGSGNNVQATGEVTKRMVPIMLQPRTANPEQRRDFQHPELAAFVKEKRADVLTALLGLVENWLAAGKPLTSNRLGGFEEWSGVIGGILGVNGFRAWRTNESEWRSAANPSGSEMEDFVTAWAGRHGQAETQIGPLLDLATELDVFSRVLSKSGRGASSSFGWMLQKHRDTPVGPWVIRFRRVHGKAHYSLESLA